MTLPPLPSTLPPPLPPTLQPLRLALRGSSLIEASAGTGKTFTIAALYLRLVLGHGGQAAFTRALTPPEILVVTFTDAATQELRDRIRARLAEAAEAFALDPAELPAGSPGQDLLQALRAEYPPAQWPGCARTLRLAAEAMDESAVSTIHSWCNRMLREHAFDSGSLFTQALQTDERELLAEAVRDYWRSFYYPLAAADVERVRAEWKTPDDLGQRVAGLLELGDALPAAEPPGVALEAARQDAVAKMAAIKAPWRAWADELLAWLNAAIAAGQVPAAMLGRRNTWLGNLRDWANGDATTPTLTATAWERLTPAGLGRVWNAGFPPPDHPALRDMATLRERIQALPDGRADLLCHAAHWIAARLASEKLRRAQMGFHDLLARLDTALQGPNGQRLALLIRQQFPVALIDEFQDTDPLQYRIFDAVYGVARNDAQTALVLIGDPKQAIYAFRGADIHTYLAARRDTAGRHSTLGTNFRSTQAMVRAVNQVFLRAERRETGQGAFLFRHGGDNPVPFLEVAARGRDERWCFGGAAAPALSFWLLDEGKPVTKAVHLLRMSDICATAVVKLLCAGQQGRAGFAAADGSLRPVRPGDIAVLVNTGREARALRRALGRRGVRSVYLSDQESVFDSAVAGDLQHWLAACAEPDDDRLLRAAMGTATLGLSWAELDRLNHDELHWEDRVLQFGGYRQLWRQQGVLPMLRRLLGDFQVPRLLLARRDERALTDLLHLAELMQQASGLLAGEHALIRHLAEQRADAGGDSDSRKLRLESDADLVKVVTVHKSKGLEYPLVFLPFASAYRAAKATDLPLKWHDDGGRLRVDLQADPAKLAIVDRERLGEDLRKLYVALTRARFATWVGVAAVPKFERGALGTLLSGGEAVDAGQLEAGLHDLRGESDAIAVLAAPAVDDQGFESEAAALLVRPDLPLPAWRQPWWIASYSALRVATGPARAERGGAVAQAADAPAVGADADAGNPPPEASPADSPGSAAEDIFAESSDLAPLGAAVPPLTPALPGEATAGLHGFPRGASAGSFLHGLLEWAGRQGFARVRDQPAEAAELIARRCKLAGLGQWTQPLCDWLGDWLRTPWPLPQSLPALAPLCPAELGATQVEMEFWLAASRVDALALDALVRRHTLDGVARAPLQPSQINGMLKGFIDLVVEHQGRYFVVDYKSNWLGPDDAGYTPQAMRDAVLHHRYDLQYTLYLFALHRLLRSRLPDYDYDRHVGGAVYLFLRGYAGPGGGLHAERPSKALIEALDDLFNGVAVA